MKQIIAILFISVIMTGCYNAPDAVKPMSWIFNQMPEDAPNAYKRAWKDGCESGLSSMTDTFYKTFYSFKQDAKLRENPTYYKTWIDIYTFCRHYAYGTIRQGDHRMNLPNAPSQFQQSFLGTEGILTTGALNMSGPGGVLMPFANFGSFGGNGSEGFGMGGSGLLDYSGESAISGANTGMTMDFTGGGFSIGQ